MLKTRSDQHDQCHFIGELSQVDQTNKGDGADYLINVNRRFRTNAAMPMAINSPTVMYTH
jgi:hypothetical protein